MGFSTNETLAGLAILLIGGLALTGNIPSLSVGGGAGDDVTEVKDATLNLAASQLGSSTKIPVTAYATFPDGTVVSKSLTASQFTAWSIFTNQDNNIEVQAFNGSNYPIKDTVSFGGSTQLNKEIKTAAIAAAGDVSLETRETSGSDNDDTLVLAAGGQETIDSLRATVDTQDVYWNVGAVYVDTPDNSNVTVEMPNAEAIAVPDSAPSTVDKAFLAYSPSNGEDTFEEFATYDSSQIVVTGDDTNDPAETVTLYVDDVQANQNSETGAIEYVIEDSSDTNLGLAEQSLSLTIS